MEDMQELVVKQCFIANACYSKNCGYNLPPFLLPYLSVNCSPSSLYNTGSCTYYPSDDLLGK